MKEGFARKRTKIRIKELMTKILHIITRMDMGGSAQNTMLTCLSLSERYDITLIFGLSRESRMTEAESQSVQKNVKIARERGVKCIPMPTLIRKIDPLRDLCAFISLCKLMRQIKPDVVHTHTSKAGLLGRWAAWKTGIPFIVHTPHGHVFYGHFRILVSKLFLFIERLTSLVTDRMVALTAGEKQDYIKLLVSKPDKTVVIHSGVDIDQYMNVQIDTEEKKRALGLSSKALVVGTVGWLLPIKGPAYLLDAMVDIWQHSSNVELVYVGKGDLEEDLKQKAMKMGLSGKVKFLGWRDDVHKIIPVFDVFVLPSMNEGMGRVLVEAMAAGKPVVASNVGGIPDLIVNGQNGFLFEPGDVNGLSAAIEKLLLDKNMRCAMGEKGQTIARDFSEEKMIKKIDALYASLLHRKSKQIITKTRNNKSTKVK